MPQYGSLDLGYESRFVDCRLWDQSGLELKDLRNKVHEVETRDTDQMCKLEDKVKFLHRYTLSSPLSYTYVTKGSGVSNTTHEADRGSKVSSKIGVIEWLLEKADILLLGGGMIFTFYRAPGLSVRSSLVEEDKLDFATSLLEEAKGKRLSLLLPTEVLFADNFASDANSKSESRLLLLSESSPPERRQPPPPNRRRPYRPPPVPVARRPSAAVASTFCCPLLSPATHRSSPAVRCPSHALSAASVYLCWPSSASSVACLPAPPASHSVAYRPAPHASCNVCSSLPSSVAYRPSPPISACDVRLSLPLAAVLHADLLLSVVRRRLWLHPLPLITAVASDIANEVLHKESAKDMWDSLAATYSQARNETRIMQLHHDIHQMRQDGRPLHTYYSSLKSMFERLNSYFSACKCEQQKTYRDMLMVGVFLSGLDSVYESAKNQMLTTLSIPPIDEAYSRLSRISIPASTVPDTTSAMLATRGRGGSFFARGRGGRGRGNTTSRPVCQLCHRIGYTVDKCWQKHGRLAFANQTASTDSPEQPKAQHTASSSECR
ncbi:Phosphoglycerate kinase [Nymphaea thermarum]|nr:Phosphoglycerate kinase [Nymphaea thermarum]